MDHIWLYVFLLALPFGQCLTTDDCDQSNSCQTVALGKDPDWYKLPGHYESIQSCIDDAQDGTTCLIQPGRYHEKVKIVNKKNLTLTSGSDQTERPLMDGTTVFWPSNGWTSDTINGNTVCKGALEIEEDNHPYQLFLASENGEYQMMTNARWPNALWTEKNPVSGAPSVFYNDHWAKSDRRSTRGEMVDRPVNGVSALAELAFSVQGAMAILNVGSFNTFVKPVKSHKVGQNNFTYEDDFGGIKFKAGNNQYFLESHEALLDNPGEWYYNKDTKVLQIMPWNGICPSENINAVRGRVMDYFFDITHSDGIAIDNLDFFASNVQGAASNNVELDSLRFDFPSSSKRMLQDFSVPKITRFIGVGDLAIRNCEFIGGEGSALNYYSSHGRARVTNNLFKWNDWTGQMSLKVNGGFGTVYSLGRAQDFVGNTLLYNGASAGFRPGHCRRNAQDKGYSPIITDNLVIGQCHGQIMHDGSGIQMQSDCQQGSYEARNWIMDSPKRGIRFDGAPGRSGINGTLINNVIWRTAGLMVKGENHHVIGNLALPNYGTNNQEPSLLVRRYYSGFVMNNHTVVEDNAAWLANGGSGLHGGRSQMAGIKSNNFYGNNSYPRRGRYDGSLVLDGKTLPKGSPNLLQSLVDPDNSDFRPKPGSPLTSTGKQIGPYKSNYESGTGYYFIPGHQEFKASYPIPHDNSIVEERDCLMFRPAYRCTGVSDKHLVYVTEKGSDFPHDPTGMTSANGNVVVLKQHGLNLKSGATYQWRVDCLVAGIVGPRIGDVWHFATKPSNTTLLI